MIFWIRIRSLREFFVMEIFFKVLVKILWILINIRLNFYFFDNVLVFFYIKEIIIFRKFVIIKRIVLFLGLIWVLFLRYILERVFECFVGVLFFSVYFSYWYSLEVISEKDVERKGINERIGVMFFVFLFRVCIVNFMVVNLVLCGWLFDFKCLVVLVFRVLIDCFFFFRIIRWWVFDFFVFFNRRIVID